MVEAEIHMQALIHFFRIVETAFKIYLVFEERKIIARLKEG